MKNNEQKTCSMCGICCKLFLINLNEKEYFSGKYHTVFEEFGTFKDFAFIEECGANIIQQNQDGSCIYLANSKCTIHENRPAVCREFFCHGEEPRFAKMREIIKKARSIDKN